jgi:hypothetical protein
MAFAEVAFLPFSIKKIFSGLIDVIGGSLVTISVVPRDALSISKLKVFCPKLGDTQSKKIMPARKTNFQACKTFLKRIIGDILKNAN